MLPLSSLWLQLWSPPLSFAPFFLHWTVCCQRTGWHHHCHQIPQLPNFWRPQSLHRCCSTRGPAAQSSGLPFLNSSMPYSFCKPWTPLLQKHILNLRLIHSPIYKAPISTCIHNIAIHFLRGTSFNWAASVSDIRSLLVFCILSGFIARKSLYLE